jgi:hypothetical protein
MLFAQTGRSFDSFIPLHRKIHCGPKLAAGVEVFAVWKLLFSRRNNGQQRPLSAEIRLTAHGQNRQHLLVQANVDVVDAATQSPTHTAVLAQRCCCCGGD